MCSIDWLLMPIGANFASGSKVSSYCSLFLFITAMSINVTLGCKIIVSILSNNNKSMSGNSQDVIKSSSCMIPLLTAPVNQILLFREQRDMISLRNQVHRLDPEIGKQLLRPVRASPS